VVDPQGHRYNTDGPAGVKDRRHDHPGAPRLLSGAQQEELRQRLAGRADDGGLWTGPKVAAWMSAQLGADREAQEEFKKRASRPR
jgi:transposase